MEIKRARKGSEVDGPPTIALTGMRKQTIYSSRIFIFDCHQDRGIHLQPWPLNDVVPSEVVVTRSDHLALSGVVE